MVQISGADDYKLEQRTEPERVSYPTRLKKQSFGDWMACLGDWMACRGNGNAVTEQSERQARVARCLTNHPVNKSARVSGVKESARKKYTKHTKLL